MHLCLRTLTALLPLLSGEGELREIPLSAPLPNAIAGDVRANVQNRPLLVSPDSQWTAYRADQDQNNLVELFVVPASGGPSRKLSAPLAPGDAVEDFEFTSDSATVVYRTQTSGRLFASAVDGSTAPIELVQGPGVDVRDFLITPGGTQVVLDATLEAGPPRIYVVPVDGSSEPVRLSRIDQVMLTWGTARRMLLTPDGQRVVYLGAEESSLIDLHSAPVDGSSTSVRLSAQTLPQGSQITSWAISPDSQRVVYISNTTQGGLFELHSVPSAGGAVTRLNAPMVPGGDVLELAIAPDSTRVVWRADALVNHVDELFVTPIQGGTTTRLSPNLATGGDVLSFAIDPTSTRVAYVADQEVDAREELYSVPLDGSAAPVKLSDPGSASDVQGDIAIAPDASYVAFRADTYGQELYRAPLAGGSPPVALDMTPFNGALSFQILPDSSRVVFLGWKSALNLPGLGCVPADGSASAADLSAPVGGYNRVHGDYRATPDSTRVVFRGDLVTSGRDELYSAPVDGSQPRTRLNPRLASSMSVAGSVFEFRLSADGRHAVYWGDARLPGHYELFSVPTDGSRRGQRLSDPNGPLGQLPVDHVLSPDSRTVLYRRAETVAGPYVLYAVPIDGSEPPRALAGSAGGLGVGRFALTADGQRVILHDLATWQVLSVPVDGSSAPISVHPELPADRFVLEFTLSLSDDRVIYRADGDVPGVFELYSVPDDGSGGAIKINAPLPAGFHVSPYYAARAGTVTYSELDTAGGSADAFVAASNGGFPTRRLNGPLAPNQFVATPRISADGAWLVYSSNEEDPTVRGLTAVPLDPSSTRLTLNPPAAPLRNVTLFDLDPTSRYVFFVLSNWAVLGGDELYVYDLLQGTGPTLVNDPLGPGETVSYFELSLDGTRLLYGSDQGNAGTVDLHSRPIDLSGPSVRISNNAVPGSRFYFVEPGPGGKVLYSADFRTLGVNEAFLANDDGQGEPMRVNRPFRSPTNVRRVSYESPIKFHPTRSQYFYLADIEGDESYGLFTTILGGPQQSKGPALRSGVRAGTR